MTLCLLILASVAVVAHVSGIEAARGALGAAMRAVTGFDSSGIALHTRAGTAATAASVMLPCAAVIIALLAPGRPEDITVFVRTARVTAC